MSAIGRSMAIAGAAIVAAFGMAIKTASQFEQSMANTASVAGATSEELKKLSNYAREMGEQSVFSASQAADAMYFLASAGMNVDQVMSALKGTLALAAATQSDLAFTAAAVAATLSQFGLDASEADRVANVFAATISMSQATMDKLATSMSYVGPMAKSMGMSLEDTVGILGNLYNAGYDASMAGTALRMAFTSLIEPNEKAQATLDKLGISIYDTSGKMRPFADIIDELARKGLSTADAMSIFGQRAGPAMLALVSQGEGAIKKLTDAVTGTDKASEMAEMQINTFQGAIKLLRSAFEELQITLVQDLMPAIKGLIEWVTEGIKKISDWMKANPELTATIVKITAGVGALMLVLGPLLMMLPGIVTGVGLLSAAIIPLAITVGLATANFVIWWNVVKEIDKILHSHHTTIEDVEYAELKLAEAQKILAERLGITIEKLKEFQKSGLSVTEMINESNKVVEEATKNWEFYHTEMAILTEAAKMGNISASALYKGMKELDEIMKLSAKGIGEVDEAIYKMAAANKVLQDFMLPVRETIENLTKSLTPHEQKIAAVNAKYDDMIEAIKMFNVSEETMKANIDKVNVARDLEIAKLEENKTAMDKLIEAKKDFSNVMRGIIDKIYEFTHTEYETKLRLINREYDELIINAKEVYKGEAELNSIIATINQARGLEIAKLGELIAKEKEDVGAKKLLADAYKTVADRIFELTHTAMEVQIRKLGEQKQVYLAAGVAIGDVDKWHKLEIATLKESTQALTENKNKIEEISKVTQWLGQSFVQVVKEIDRAKVSLNAFTIEALAAAIAAIKMHYYPEIVRLTERITQLFGAGQYALRSWYEADLKRITGAMASDINTVIYGYETYNETLKNLGGTYGNVANAANNAGRTMVSSWVSVTNAANQAAQAVSKVSGTSGWVVPTTTPTTTTPTTTTSTSATPNPIYGGWGQIIGYYQHGTPYVPRTGLAMVHKGEEINPPGQRSYDQRKSYTSSINIEPGAIQIITPKFDESDAQNIFRLLERQAKMRGLKFAIS